MRGVKRMRSEQIGGHRLPLQPLCRSGTPQLISKLMRALRYFGSIGLMALAGALCFFALHGCGNRRGLSKLKPCRLPGIEEELLCGKFTVFENRQTRTGRTIDLNIVVFPAFDQKDKAEPLFDLAGGPGAASTAGAMFYASARKRVSAQTRRRAGRSARHRQIERVNGVADQENAAGLSEGNVSGGLH